MMKEFCSNTKTYVIWGFLGSGKTTLINYLLSYRLKDKKVVVLENESGKESVDGVVLQSKNFNVVNMEAGCICCSLRLKLVDAINEIKQCFAPDIILIEPSGLASLGELFNIPNLELSGTISLLDVTMYDLLMRLNPLFYRRQFYLSSVLFLTKAERVDAEKLMTIKTDLLVCQPSLTIIDDYRRMDDKEWKQMEKSINNFKKPSCSMEIVSPTFENETIVLKSPVDVPFFESNFVALNQIFGSLIVRAKGLICNTNGKWFDFEFAGNECSFKELSNHVRKEEGFLTVWWKKGTDSTPKEWITYFLQAKEVECKPENLVISDKELFGYMGYKGNEPDPFMIEMIKQLKEEALSVCQPRLGYRFLTGKRIDEQNLVIGGKNFHPAQVINDSLQDADFYVSMVSSVGTELDCWLKEKQASDDMISSFIADAIGSALVEAIVSYGVINLRKMVGKWKLKISNAYSPGYCDWSVSEQQILFSLLPARFCGVELNESSLMLPIKSVSSLISVGFNIEKKPYGCAICKKKNCYKRGVRKSEI